MDWHLLRKSLFIEMRSDNASQKEKNSLWVKRAFGNMFEVRICSAIGSSTTAAFKLHSTLSPWGDNNPFVLPSFRPTDLLSLLPFGFEILDIVIDGSLEGLKHLSKCVCRDYHPEKKAIIQDSIKAEADNLSELIVRKEQVALPPPKGIKTIKVKVKHKWIGVNADISLVSERPRPDKSERRLSSRRKGWFCPYLYCTGRKAHIRRAQDFSIAELKGPGRSKVDGEVARRLLLESPSLLLLCNPDTSAVEGFTKRMIILFTGISSRVMWLWSQSR